MSKVELIDKAISNIKLLPETELREVNDFAEFLLSKAYDKQLTDEVTKTNITSKAYQFLEEGTDLYTVNDLKEKEVKV